MGHTELTFFRENPRNFRRPPRHEETAPPQVQGKKGPQEGSPCDNNGCPMGKGLGLLAPVTKAAWDIHELLLICS